MHSLLVAPYVQLCPALLVSLVPSNCDLRLAQLAQRCEFQPPAAHHLHVLLSVIRQ